MTAFWCRAGTAATITPPGMPGMIGPPGPAYGDTISGTNLAGGIAAALLKRERTGEPSVVDVSLLGSGLWAMGHTVALTKHLGERMEAFPPGVHGSPINPLVGLYPTADDRYISFVMMQPTKFWADVCRHMDLDELVDDPRFATAESIAENTAAAVEILTEAMAKRPLAEWSERFATLAGPWAPVQDTLQAAEDAQIRANEYIVQGGRARIGGQPGAVRCQPRRRPARHPVSPSRPTKSCWNSVWTGTASSSSRRPAPSPRPSPPEKHSHALPCFHRHLPAVLGNPPAPGGRRVTRMPVTMAVEAHRIATPPPTVNVAEIDDSFTGIDEIGYEGSRLRRAAGGLQACRG